MSDFAKGLVVGMNMGGAVQPPPVSLTWRYFKLKITALQNPASPGYAGVKDMHLYDGAGLDLVPVMTAAVNGAVTVSASSVYGMGYEAWRAFDNPTLQSLWVSATGVIPVSLVIDLGSSKQLKSYSFQAYDVDTGINAKAWTFEGSLDGITWTVLDSHVNVLNWLANERRSFSLAS